MTEQIVALLGTGVIDRHTPAVTADDLGLTRGDGCFEATLAVRDAAGVRVLDLEEHLDRLDHSAAALEIEGTPSHAAWGESAEAALARWSGRQGVLKLMLTRGLETGGSAPTAVLTLTSLPDAVLARRRGVRACTLERGYASDAFVAAPWLLGGVKTLSYAINVAAKREAERRGCSEVLFVSADGYALEGPNSALVWLDADTLVTTPVEGTGVLRSITQTKLWAAPPAGLRTEYRLVTPDAVRAGGGAWFLSSVVGVQPLTHLDGVELARDHDVEDALRGAVGFAGL